MRWHRPSPGGRRLAVERKFALNVEAYGGPVSILTATAPGSDSLPWDTDACALEGPHKCSGELGCKVEWIYATVYNHTAQARASRLFEAAQRSADRVVRRQWGGELPRQIGNVGRAKQLRGVDHFHWMLPQGSEVERAWSRHVRRFLENVARRERELGAEAVWEALEREYMTGEPTRGIYGFGFSHPGRARHSAASAASYMARNAANYLAGQGARHYVSSRLTRETGVTMRVLRAVNWLYVRRKQIEAGELLDDLVPGYWSPEWTERVLRVQALVAPAQAP